MNATSPKFSIIVPCLDRVELLEYTLASIRIQSIEDWECLVVGDGSTIKNLVKIKAMIQVDSRFQLIERQNEPRGAARCRNIGWCAANSDNIIFVDSDDALHVDCLKMRWEALQSFPGNDFLIFATCQFKYKMGDLNVLINVCSHEDPVSRFLKMDVPWLTTGVLWKVSTLKSLNGWDERLLSWQDWDLSLRALLDGLKYKCFPSVDNYWRIPDPKNGSISLEAVKPEHCKSHEYLLGKLASRFHHEQNAENRAKLKFLWFWLALQWVKNNQPERAKHVWHKACLSNRSLSDSLIGTYLGLLTNRQLRKVLLPLHRYVYRPGYELWRGTFRSVAYHP